MNYKDAVVIFEEVPIRKIWDNKEQWLSAIDVAKALDYENPSRAVNDMIRNNKEVFEGYSCLRSDRMQNENGITQGRKATFLNLKGVIAFCLKSNQKKAIPFQRWAVNKLEKLIDKIPEEIKLIATTRRVKFTDQLKEHGFNKPSEYIAVTKSMKDNLDIDKNKPKSECDLIEVMKIAAAEMIATINIIQDNPKGFIETKPICDQSAQSVNKITGIRGIIHKGNQIGNS